MKLFFYKHLLIIRLCNKKITIFIFDKPKEYGR